MVWLNPMQGQSGEQAQSHQSTSPGQYGAFGLQSVIGRRGHTTPQNAMAQTVASIMMATANTGTSSDRGSGRW